METHSYTWYQRRVRTYNAATGSSYSAKQLKQSIERAQRAGVSHPMLSRLQQTAPTANAANLTRAVERSARVAETAIEETWRGYAAASPAAERVLHAPRGSYIVPGKPYGRTAERIDTPDGPRWLVTKQGGAQRVQKSLPAGALPATAANKERVLAQMARDVREARTANIRAYAYAD